MHDTDKTRCTAHMCRIFREFLNGLCHSVEEKRIQFFLVAVNQWIQFARTGKYKMVIVNVQYVFILCIDPQFVG